ncbi:hypothetical protein BC941DRAFT_167062 [Chlamydoabsidia padenii]|nr:hypothetical protein BC941DRAFT_167062 [Chlamydoabsidia padenii]
MNSTPNTNQNTNAKSTPQAVFNYAQAAKRNNQNLEQQQKVKPTGPNKQSNPINSSSPPVKQQQQNRNTNSTAKDNVNKDVISSTKSSAANV